MEKIFTCSYQLFFFYSKYFSNKIYVSAHTTSRNLSIINDYFIYLERNSIMYKILTGLVSGFLNGLLGSGGGTIVVPALEFIHKIEEHKAHATAILIILPLSIISTAIYFNSGNIIISSSLKVVGGSILGSLLGAKLLNKLSSKNLRKFFGIVLILAAIRLVLS